MSILNILAVGSLAVPEGLVRHLGFAEVVVERADGVAQASRSQQARPADVVLAPMRAEDGDCVAAMRAWADVSAVVVLAESATLAERVAAFDNGAEDVVTPPAPDRELALRLEKALGRWRRRTNGAVVRFSGLALDPGARMLRREGGGEVALSDAERSLLELLLARPDRPASRREIARRCLRSAFHERSRAPDMLASKLRAKLRKLGRDASVEALRGEGYMLRIGDGPRRQFTDVRVRLGIGRART